MKVYGVKGSPFVSKALVALEEKGLPYELETMVSISPKPRELLALHPRDRGRQPDSHLHRNPSVLARRLSTSEQRGRGARGAPPLSRAPRRSAWRIAVDALRAQRQARTG